MDTNPRNLNSVSPFKFNMKQKLKEFTDSYVSVQITLRKRKVDYYCCHLVVFEKPL